VRFCPIIQNSSSQLRRGLEGVMTALEAELAGSGDRFFHPPQVLTGENVGTETRVLGQKASYAVSAATKNPGF